MEFQGCQTTVVAGIAPRAEQKDVTPPQAAKLLAALRHIGYKFEHAIADLVDNSVSAGASTVLIRFICKDDAIRSIVIADDGTGMDAERLTNAMRFGSERDLEPKSLGKYGMGLKLASFSHARCLTVATRSRGVESGRQWTVDGIERGWYCHVLGRAEAAAQLAAPWSPVDLSESGTLVIWHDVDKVPVSSAGLRNTLRGLAMRLQLHLGLCFHRFIEAGALSIFIDQQTAEEREHSIRVPVRALNPFAYPRSGHAKYPKEFLADIPGIGVLVLRAHIWPANSELPEYKLGNRAAARQGFYFYRNGRLIQAGGWNGVVQHDTEPHSSLARIEVDLPTELDGAFGLNVQKSSVIVPPGFEAAVSLSKSPDGDSFEPYRRAAQQVYRRQDARAAKAIPFVPGDGMPQELQRAASELLSADGKGRTVSFHWESLEEDELFRLDRDQCAIKLNSLYRKQLLGERRASVADVPLLKTMLFLLVEEGLNSDRVSGLQKKRMAVINELLLKAAKLAKG